jgi:hypothetical protein
MSSTKISFSAIAAGVALSLCVGMASANSTPDKCSGPGPNDGCSTPAGKLTGDKAPLRPGSGHPGDKTAPKGDGKTPPGHPGNKVGTEKAPVAPGSKHPGDKTAPVGSGKAPEPGSGHPGDKTATPVGKAPPGK